jgi:hypothetical protein
VRDVNRVALAPELALVLSIGDGVGRENKVLFEVLEKFGNPNLRDEDVARVDLVTSTGLSIESSHALPHRYVRFHP